jgi:prophage DNA circulation protein
MAYFQFLLPAMWRGVPFGVLSASTGVGRRVAVHEYPYRDTPYIEDLGRSVRRIRMRGFLVENDLATFMTGPVILQRGLMLAAAEQRGPGILIHPTLGRLNVSLVDLEMQEKWDEGRYIELRFHFLDAGRREFPTLGSSILDAVFIAAHVLNSAAALSNRSRANRALLQGAAVTRIAGIIAAAWAAQAVAAGSDATNSFNLVSAAPGNNGRFAGGGLEGAFASAAPLPGPAPSAESLLLEGTVSRANIADAAASLTETASTVSVSS